MLRCVILQKSGDLWALWVKANGIGKWPQLLPPKYQNNTFFYRNLFQSFDRFPITNTFPPKANTSNQHCFCAKFFSSIACRVSIISDTFPAAFRRYLEFPTTSLKIEYCHQFFAQDLMMTDPTTPSYKDARTHVTSTAWVQRCALVWLSN